VEPVRNLVLGKVGPQAAFYWLFACKQLCAGLCSAATAVDCMPSWSHCATCVCWAW
jgi:hypothetical protein